MIVIVAGVGRHPFAQMLRNSLSGHPPPIGHGTNTANPKQHSYHGHSRRPATGHGLLPQDATPIKHCLVEHSNKQMHQESGHEDMYGDMWTRTENEIPGEPDYEETEHSP